MTTVVAHTTLFSTTAASKGAQDSGSLLYIVRNIAGFRRFTQPGGGFIDRAVRWSLPPGIEATVIAKMLGGIVYLHQFTLCALLWMLGLAALFKLLGGFVYPRWRCQCGSHRRITAWTQASLNRA